MSLTKQKILLMKELCDCYEQAKFINDEHTRKIMNTYIDEKETKLFNLLMKDKKIILESEE